MLAAKRIHSAGGTEGRQLDHIFYDGFEEFDVSILFKFLGVKSIPGKIPPLGISRMNV